MFIATSLDGFIARPDGGIDWLHDADPIPDGGDARYSAFFDSVDVLVMGRGTFEKVLEFDEFPYTGTPVIVMSNSLTTVPEGMRDHVEIKSGTPRQVTDTLAAKGYQHVYLDGGQLIQSFLRAGLVDEIILTRIPILIGEGRPLFGALEQDIHLTHVHTQTWANGFVQSTYQIKTK